MKQQHTPEPWEISKSGPRYSINAGDRHIAMVSCYVRKDGDEEEENIANASLMAAAPELLDALEDLEKCYRGGYQTCDDATIMAVREKARAAIKKARGE